jgi:hypothetical protein
MDLDGAGQNYADLLSGSGSVSDEAVIVHALSAAVAAAVQACGPSPVTRYAPAQETALDDMTGLRVSDVGGPAALRADVSQAVEGLAQEKKLAALGPQGMGGGCTIAMQMGGGAEGMGQADGFRQDLGVAEAGLLQSQQAIARVRSELAVISKQGLTSPPRAAEAITAARQRLRSALTAINDDISSENSAIAQAYTLANNMAKIPATPGRPGTYFGSCLGDAPGQPPTPIPPIS